MDYILHIIVIAAIYTGLTASLDLLAGRAGLLSVAHAAFYGLGAYTSALVTTRLEGGFAVGVLAGMCGAVLLSLLVSAPSMRLRGEHFVIGSFGFQMLFFIVLNNWTDLTRGPLGIPGISTPTILGWHVDTQIEFVVLATLFAGLSYGVIYQLVSSPFGRVLHAIREDEVLAATYGKNVAHFKIAAFSVSATLAAANGSLYAHYASYIDPSSFNVMESVSILAMVIIGGAGTLWGPLFGAVIMVSVPEGLRFLGFPDSVAANLRQIMFGIVLVGIPIFRPQGLAPRRRSAV